MPHSVCVHNVSHSIAVIWIHLIGGKQYCHLLSEELSRYVGVLISPWLFLFAAQAKEFFLNVLKKLEQRSHKCVELRGRGEYVEEIHFFQSRSLLFSL
jgi:hypothetical protein